MLLEGYPSHGFVIDYNEAKSIFRKVARATGDIGQLIELIGHDGYIPRNEERDEDLLACYINTETPNADSNPEGKPEPEAANEEGDSRTEKELRSATGKGASKKKRARSNTGARKKSNSN
jgi:hypothetical protein